MRDFHPAVFVLAGLAALAGLAGLGGLGGLHVPALAQAQSAVAPQHGVSLFGELKYGPGFTHFDYVNPNAPKAGRLRFSSIGTFDSLNPFIIRGRPAAGLGLVYDTLTTSSLDEPGSEYGLLAQSVEHPADYAWVTFTLRPDARFHDGVAVTSADVIWSMETLKAHNPFYRAYYAEVTDIRASGAHRVTFTFARAGNRELPHIVGQLPVLPKHFWEQGRDFNATTLEPPLGSGPYRVAEVSAGRFIEYDRAADYWASDLPVNAGQHNFDRIRIEYFRDDDVALEAFKADVFDFRAETASRKWATAYDVPQVRKDRPGGHIVREEAVLKNSAGMQAFVFNLRRARFADPRVREAFNWAFDFEYMNKALFYGQYTRTDSYFSNSELKAQGTPEGLELELLEPWRGHLPGRVFSEPYANPVTDGSGRNRENLRRARALLEQAGWRIRDGALTSERTGEIMAVEFLLVQPEFERVVQAYVTSLARLGVATSLRTVDTAQYQNRIDTYDFDAVIATFRQSLSPGNEQRDFWGSEQAHVPGGRNLAGIEDEVVDALIERIVLARDRAHLVAAVQALDRVLLHRHYVVPQWHIPYQRLAYWSRLAHPDPLPGYGVGFPAIWWHAQAADAGP